MEFRGAGGTAGERPAPALASWAQYRQLPEGQDVIGPSQPHIVTIHQSPDGERWSKFGVQMEISGYHHSVAGEFLSLRPAIYAAGRGAAVFRDVRYQAFKG